MSMHDAGCPPEALRAVGAESQLHVQQGAPGRAWAWALTIVWWVSLWLLGVMMCVCIYTYIYIHVYTLIHIHIYIYICVYTYTHSYMHTYIHTQLQPLQSLQNAHMPKALKYLICIYIYIYTCNHLLLTMYCLFSTFMSPKN